VLTSHSCQLHNVQLLVLDLKPDRATCNMPMHPRLFACNHAAALHYCQHSLYVEDVLGLCKLLVQQRQHTALRHLQQSMQEQLFARFVVSSSWLCSVSVHQPVCCFLSSCSAASCACTHTVHCAGKHATFHKHHLKSVAHSCCSTTVAALLRLLKSTAEYCT
jgi:hypothetical protein